MPNSKLSIRMSPITFRLYRSSFLNNLYLDMPVILKAITQNCFFGKKVKEISNLIIKHQPDICCLQEVTGEALAEKIKINTNFKYLLSKTFYTLFPRIKFHNAIFTNLPVLKQGEKYWLKKRGARINRFAGIALWAVIKKGSTKFLLYNCHFNVTGQGMEDRKEMVVDIVNQACKFNCPVIICGDMNTVIPDKKSFRR